MPVSATSKATTLCAWLRMGWLAVQPAGAAKTLSCTPPRSVNLNAFDSRFLSTCWSRLESVMRVRPSAGSRSTLNESCRVSASWRNGLPTASSRLVNRSSSASTVTVPDSIFDRSRISLIRFNRSVPAPWMVRANSVCFDERFPSGLSASCCPRIRMLLSGVRSSCDMFARNSDLYLEVRASSAAFSSSARRACSISWFFLSTSTFRSASCCAFCSS